MHGHWDVSEASVDNGLDASAVVGKSVNMGVGIVVPCSKVMEILNQDDFKAERERMRTNYTDAVQKGLLSEE